MAATLAGFAGAELNGRIGGMALRNGSVASLGKNSACISEIIDSLSLQLRGHIRSGELFRLCLSLSRQIDFAMANHEVPNRVLELPSLFKKVCLWKHDTLMQAVIMVLMISVKNACQTGWFSDRDSEELSNLAKEIASNFCSMPNFNTEPSCSNSVITTIMSRFYPRMKMGHLFFYMEVKPGFDAYVRDFQISENLKPAPGEKIRLFVGQMDTIETSACLITPSKVNFLVNGCGVERRNNLYMDKGPQNPTVLTHLLTYGLNVLQAVGEFNGNYLIAVACMSEVPQLDSNSLLDSEYAPPIVDSDSEIVEGTSRISLSCPISLRHIKTPVKGRSCKHIQCFDFDNYVGINSTKPSWRCPYCNQHVSFTDLRIDQKMVKILKKVGTNVTDVIFASDGSWSAVMETDDNTHMSEDRNSNSGQNESPQIESVGLLNVPVDILDLTQNDSMDVTLNESEDRKLSSSALQSGSLTQTMVVDPDRTNTNDMNQSNARAEDDSWFRIFMSTFGSGLPDLTSNAQNLRAYASTWNHIAAPAVLPEIPITARNRVCTFTGNALASTSIPQSKTSLPAQQYEFGNPTMTNEYGRFPSAPRQVSRTPIAVQAPHIMAPVLQQTSTDSVNTFMQNGLSEAYQAYSTVRTNTNSTISSNLLHLPPSSSNQYPVIESYWQQDSSLASARLTHQNVTHHAPTNQVPNAYRVTDGRQISSQKMVNVRMPQTPGRNQSPALPPGIHCFRSPVHMGGLQDRIGQANVLMNSQQAHLIAAANRATYMALDPSRTLAAPTFSMNPETSSSPLVGDNVINPGNQNCRPAGRMRGALSGQAFTDAMNEYIIRPSQQAARHISDVNSLLNKPPPAATIFHG